MTKKPAMRIAALALGFRLLVAPAAAETRQHGNLIFDPPQGWRSAPFLRTEHSC
ncbi:MAG: hypothetical protein IPL38_11335 [Rhodobacter sp.]|nr:hypothetical protein [Rhodobacter sp.]